jgi:phosphomannomutase/phosphoglucomutase
VELRSGKVVMAPCGYPFILRAMAEHRGVFGFENTGHYFFDNPDIKFDDATFAAAVMCQVLSSQEQTVGEIIASAPKYFTADEVRWKCDDELKFRVVEELRVQYEREYRVNATDGVRVELPDGWALVRASNTAPELTMRWEGRTEEARDRIGDELLARVREVMEQLGVG